MGQGAEGGRLKGEKTEEREERSELEGWWGPSGCWARLSTAKLELAPLVRVGLQVRACCWCSVHVVMHVLQHCAVCCECLVG